LDLASAGEFEPNANCSNSNETLQYLTPPYITERSKNERVNEPTSATVHDYIKFEPSGRKAIAKAPI